MFTDKGKKRPYVSSEGLLNLKSLITQNALSINKSQKQNDDEIEEKRRKKSQVYPNQNVIIDYLTKSNRNKSSNRRFITTNEQQNFEHSNFDNTTDKISRPSKRIVIAETPSSEDERILDTDLKEINNNRVILQSNSPTVTSNHSNDESNTSTDSNNKNSMVISRFPSLSSMNIGSSSNNTKALLSLPSQTINSIYDEHETRTNQSKSICDIPSPDQTTSSMNKHSTIEFFTNRKVIADVNDSLRAESTNSSGCQYSLPSDLLDCCQTYYEKSISIGNNSDHLTSFPNSIRIRDTMINISNRLTKMTSLPIVDTHCHFDLIFDRLYIQYNNLTKYFDDYKEFYPSGFLFELAIQVFWRPRHLTEKNWTGWYSKYLDDGRVYGSCGIHPHWSSAWEETSIKDIERCLKHPKVVALGEIGLDFGPKNKCKIEEQSRVFEEQLKLAVKWSKPIVIHSRNAYQQTFNIMKQHLKPDHKIHLHCFVGTMADVYLFTSYFNAIKFGFTPVISRSYFLHPVIQQLDLTQILSETDSPYFIPEELSDLTDCAHPSMVYSVVEIIAQIRHLSVYDVAYQLRENARQIYGV